MFNNNKKKQNSTVETLRPEGGNAVWHTSINNAWLMTPVGKYFKKQQLKQLSELYGLY